MLQSHSICLGTGLALLSLSPCFAQPTTGAVRPVANWPTPLYWQPVQNRAPESHRAVRAQGADPAALTATPGAPAIFVAATPCRLADTRTGEGFSGAFGPPAMAANTARTIPVPVSSCGIPAAVAYSLNITVVPAAGAVTGYVKAWPDDEAEPNAAVLTDTVAGAIVGNSGIIPAGADGGIQVLTQTSVDLVIDVNGYFALPASLPLGGTAAAPALTFGDTATGLFSTGAGTLGIATGGVAALTIGADGNLDLRGSVTKGGALFLHNLGSSNTAAGLNALTANTASGNTALGESALRVSTNGFTNTAVGYVSMWKNTVGNDNTAVGAVSLASNTAGYENTAVGRASLGANTTGDSNSGFGYGTLASNVTGNNNTAVGADALENVTTGRDNTVVGAGSGANLVTGSYNIYVYNLGNNTDNGAIRIGSSNQTSAFIAGIRGTATGQPGAIPVVVDANGQLGTASSSRRVKRDISAVGDMTGTLMSLRPVQFRYSAYGPDSPLQYGLIAEEVAEVAPDLVARKTNGEVETVYYDKVNALLLGLVQKQQRAIEEMKLQNENLRKLTAAHDAELRALRDRWTEAAATPASGAVLFQDSSPK